MSREQLILAVLLLFIIVAGLPAFLVSTTSSSNPREPEPFASVSVPETTLNIEPTTKAERKEIKRRRKVNINTADSATLLTLPNIGLNRAKAILKFRKEGGVFHNRRDLRKVKGLGKRRSSNLAKHLKYGTGNYREPNSRLGKIDINDANLKQLKKLPGIGPVLASRILTYREQNGDFDTYSDLDKINGIGAGIIDKVSGRIKGVSGRGSSSSLSGSNESGGSFSGVVYINTAGQSTLEKLPGIGPVTAKAILEYRRSNGDFGSVDQLEVVDGIGPATLDDIRSTVTVR